MRLLYLTPTGETADYLPTHMIGDPWDLLSCEVGKILEENGLRLANGKASMESIANGYAKAYRTKFGVIAYYWKKDIVEALVKKHAAKSK